MVSSGDVNIQAEPLPGKGRPVEDPRIYLAAERTFLAWVRTSLALMGFGFLIARFGLLIRETEVVVQMPEHTHRPTISPWLGFTMICFGVVVCLVSSDHREEFHLDDVDQTGGHQRPVHRQAAVRAQRHPGLLLE